MLLQTSLLDLVLRNRSNAVFTTAPSPEWECYDWLHSSQSKTHPRDLSKLCRLGLGESDLLGTRPGLDHQCSSSASPDQVPYIQRLFKKNINTLRAQNEKEHYLARR
jgi:hypothetical protein